MSAIIFEVGKTASHPSTGYFHKEDFYLEASKKQDKRIMNYVIVEGP